MENIEELEEFDKLKTQVLKYVLYKKRSEAEVREKFTKNTGNMLESVVEYLKENGYIDDNEYINKSVNEFKRLKNMSIKEVQYKLLSKGLKKDMIDDYIYNNREDLLEYEINSAKQILIKKETSMERRQVIEYLRKKGYMQETIKIIQSEG